MVCNERLNARTLSTQVMLLADTAVRALEKDPPDLVLLARLVLPLARRHPVWYCWPVWCYHLLAATRFGTTSPFGATICSPPDLVLLARSREKGSARGSLERKHWEGIHGQR